MTITLLVGIVLASGCTESNNQTNQQNSTTNTNVTQNATAQDVVAIQSGPSTAHKGENVNIKCNVTNTGNNSVSNVKARSQNFDRNLGTINPGETREFQSVLYIPTDQDVKNDFGPNATVSNPFLIGGFVVTYQDAIGSETTINSNSLRIPLV